MVLLNDTDDSVLVIAAKKLQQLNNK
jgi:hypothetical protein